MRFRPLLQTGPLPTVIEPGSGTSDLVEVAARHKEDIRDLLGQSGALLFRGFDVDTPKFAQFVDHACGKRIEYEFRSSPRTSVGDAIYTSTIYPANREIPLHCENSYHADWPTRIAFYSVTPAASGGETPIADMVRVTKRLPDSLLRKFRERGVGYLRNFHPGVDLPWTDVFQTESKAEVERMCRDIGMEYRWLPDGHLRTMQKCQGTMRHPDTGEEVFFNQAHLFHVSNLGPDVESALVEVYGLENLPRNSCYGDGGAIDSADLKCIRSAFDAEAVAFPWQAGDVLLVDNMRVAHGRRTYQGARSVLVGMGSPYSKLAKRRQSSDVAAEAAVAV